MILTQLLASVDLQLPVINFVFGLPWGIGGLGDLLPEQLGYVDLMPGKKYNE